MSSLNGESSERPLTEDSSTKNPRDSSTKKPLLRDFSEILSERYQHWRKLKNNDPNDKIAFALWSEHQLLEQQIVAGDLDEEIYHSCLKESNLSFLIILLYLSNMLNIDDKKTSIFGPKIRRMEKLRLLTSNAKVTKDEIELMVKISSKIRGPHPTKSHLESIKTCIRYAQEWIDGDLDLVVGTPKISYAMLKKSVTTIVGSDYFKSLPPSPLEKRSYHKNYFETTLATWLGRNSHNILNELMVTSTDGKGESQKSYRIKAFRLSPEVRLIIWGVLRKLQKLHKESQVCESLTIDNVYVSESLEVEFRTKVTSGSYLNNFKQLKILLENVMKRGSPGCEINSRYPEDLLNFMELIDEGDKDNRNVLYNHPFVWSTCDLIKNIYLFTAIYESSTERVRLDMTKHMKLIPERVQANWIQRVLPGSSYKDMLDDWSSFRSKLNDYWELLYYMRDAYAHLHQHVKGRQKQSLYMTENELYTMFPSYVSHVVKIACDIEAFRGVLSTYDEE